MESSNGKPPDKARLRSLNELDGRTNAAKRARALVEAIESDLGGSDRLTAGEREIVQRAAITSAMLENIEVEWLTGNEVDIGAYCALTNNLRRLLTTVGLERRPRDVTLDLDKYLASRAQQ